MQGKCNNFEPCSKEGTKLFFSELSGLRLWVCDEHFQLLQEKEQQDRKVFGLSESKTIIFDDDAFYTVRGR